MRKSILAGVLAFGLLPLLTHSPSANADWVYKKITGCPKNNVTILPVGSNASIDDVIVSANKNQTVTLKFTPGPLIIMSVNLKANEPVVSNFTGNIEADNDQALKLDCSGTQSTTVTVTVVGNGSL